MLVGLAGASFYFYSRYQHAQTLLKNPSAAALEEIKTITDKVGRHMLLPADEIPTIATVTDKTNLTSQPFFARSEIGDRLLVYRQAAKAIIYRPGIDRVIEVGPLNIGPNVAGASTPSAQMLPAARLAIYNSTNTVGLASVAQQKVNRDMPSTLTVTSKQNSIGSFAKSIVVVLVPEAKLLGTQLGELFGAEVRMEMPKDEIKPDTDLLLIVGQDFVQQ